MPAQSKGVLRLSHSYNFVDKDNIIDEIRTIIGDDGRSINAIANVSNVNSQTIKKWFSGKTKRPQAPTIDAVLKPLGYRLGMVKLDTKVVPTTNIRLVDWLKNDK